MSKFAPLTPVLSWIFLNAATCVLLTVRLRYRLYFLPAIIVPAIISFKTIQHLNFIPGFSELWGTITMIGWIHLSSLLYIKGWTLRAIQSSTKASKRTHNCLGRELWTQMYKVALSPRFVRIPFKNVVIEQRSGSQVKSTAVHGKFSMIRALWLLIKIGANLFLNGLAKEFLNPININDFTAPRTILLRRLMQPSIHDRTGPISAREITMRIWFTVNSIWTPILLLDCIHTVLAIFFIYVIRIDIPDDWPDLFGSPLEAYTIGRFWTRFWHRVHLSGYSDYAKLFINVLPHSLRRYAAVKKMYMTLLLFLFSGLIHQVTTWQLDSDCSDYADIQFFCMNAVAVVLESVLLQVICPSQSSLNRKHSKTEKHNALKSLRVALVRMMGYVWVMSFFVWATPKVYYPRVYCMIDHQAQLRKTTT